MIEEHEYELGALCQKLTHVLTEHECLTKTRSVFKSFAPTIKKVKSSEYLTFDRYLTDVKAVFASLKKLGNLPPNLDDAEKEFAEELNTLIKMDYYRSGNESDTSASDSAAVKICKKQDKSPKSAKKKKSAKTPPAKSPKVDKTSPVAEKIKIKLKLTPNKADSKNLANFDFDVNSSKVQSLCNALLKTACVERDVRKTFSILPDRDILPDYYDIIQEPMSISLIKSTIDKSGYTSLFHCYSDILLMCLNAKTYNEPKTDLFEMAERILVAVEAHMQVRKMSERSLCTLAGPQVPMLDFEGDRGRNSSDLLYIEMWTVYCQVLCRCNKNKRPLTTAFIRLPDKKQLPLYYKEISNPLSISSIRSKIICGRYSSLSDLIADLAALCNNALKFNTKSSVISKDAASIKEFVTSLSLANKKGNEKTSPSKGAKLGEKRKANVISKARTPSKESAKSDKMSLPSVKRERAGKTGSPMVKKERLETPKQAAIRVMKPAVKAEVNTPSRVKLQGTVLQTAEELRPIARVVETTQSEDEVVFCCFAELKNKGPAIQGELVRTCSMFHQKIDTIPDLEDILERTENSKATLLLIVCAMYSRIDTMCPEFQTIEQVLDQLAQLDGEERTGLLECVPNYTYQGKKYYLQEELMSIYRRTSHRELLLHNSSINRISKKRGEIFSEIPNLDVLSEDLILLECSDVKRTLTTPILEKLRKGVKQNAPHVQKFKFVDIKTDNVPKTPKPNPTKTYKSRTPKTGDSTPKSLIRRPNEAINEPMDVAEISKSTITKKEPPQFSPKKLEQDAADTAGNARALALVRSLKTAKDRAGELLFEDFIDIPKSKAYHSVIKFPMSLNVIEQDLEKDTMETIEDVISSCLLIVKNARYYNEEKSEVEEKALQLQRKLLGAVSRDSHETIILANGAMKGIVAELRWNTDVEQLTRVDSSSKFINMTFSQFSDNVESGYFTRLDRFQDDLLHLIVTNMNTSLFTAKSRKLLAVFKHYLETRDKIAHIKSRSFYLTVEKFVSHYKERLDIDIPASPVPTITQNNISYVVGDKVLVKISEDDEMILLITSLSSPCWVAGTVHFDHEDTLYKTDIQDIVHVKYVLGKMKKRYRHCSYNYRTRSFSDITTNNTSQCNINFKSFFSFLSLSRYNTETVVHGKADDKTFYMQYVRENGDVFKVGDFVHLRSEKELPYIARIDKIYKDLNEHGEENVWVHGPWFIRPMDTKFYASKGFYPNEVHMSNISDINHINSIESRCEVLTSRDYSSRHPVGYLEKDVYLCDTRYDETHHKFSKLPESKLYNNTELSRDFEQTEWLTYPGPRVLTRILNYSFQKPVKVEDLVTDSEEEDSDEESCPEPEEKEEPARAVQTPRGPARKPAAQHITPRARVISQPTLPHEKPSLEKRVQVNSSIAITNSSTMGQRFTPVQSSFSRTQPTTDLSTVISPRVQPISQRNLMCRWGACRDRFNDKNDYYKHVINTQTHLDGAVNKFWKCIWAGCIDNQARTEGCGSQILLRRHLLQHMTESGYTPGAPAKRPQILRHSEAYKNFLNKLIIQKQAVVGLTSDTAEE